MPDKIEVGDLVFLREGGESIAGVRQVLAHEIVVHVENAGEFRLPLTAVRRVHDRKVVVVPEALPSEMSQAIRHIHDREDPSVAG
jgi:hypothetical protein